MKFSSVFSRYLDGFAVSFILQYLPLKKAAFFTWDPFLESPHNFRAEKPLVKLRSVYSVKLVFSYVVKGIKIKITAKFRASRRLDFEDTKRIMSPEMRPKSFGTFEKGASG